MSRDSIQAMCLAPLTKRDENWLLDAAQRALEVEFFTIPLYLCGWWSVKDPAHYAATLMREVVHEEMAHMATMANLKRALSSAATVDILGAAPDYPDHVPYVDLADVYALRGLDESAINSFVRLEAPDCDDSHRGPPDSVGEFYQEVQRTLRQLNPPLSTVGQLHGHLTPMVMPSIERAVTAISQIIKQGEGSGQDPTDTGLNDLSHYWRFRELSEGRRYRYDYDAGRWSFKESISPYDVFPCALVPTGGWQGPAHAAARPLLDTFSRAYGEMLRHLHAAWNGGGQSSLVLALEGMFGMRGPARALMQTPIPRAAGGDGTQTYTPEFRPPPA